MFCVSLLVSDCLLAVFDIPLYHLIFHSALIVCMSLKFSMLKGSQSYWMRTHCNGLILIFQLQTTGDLDFSTNLCWGTIKVTNNSLPIFGY